MKSKTLLLILALGFIISVFSQKPSLELTFTAVDNGQYVALDSVLIENLTQGGDTSLYSPDTLLLMDYMVGIGSVNHFESNTFNVSQNFPNPFKEKTEVNLYLAEKENIKITVRDILGRELFNYKNSLNRGSHSFVFYPGNEKYYLFTVSGKHTSKTIKMLNTNTNTADGGSCKIIYNNYIDNLNRSKSQEAINNFGFNLGDELRYTGYAKTIDNISGNAVISDTPQENTEYYFSILKGIRCPGYPTVADIDGNIYNTVQIGSQCWMKENLKTTNYQNNIPISNVQGDNSWSNLTTGAYVWYGNNISWKDSYGALYNWFAVDDPNGLCPSGWHVPEQDEWIILINFIGGSSAPHGNELKSCRQVLSPLGGNCNTPDHPRWDPHEFEYGTDDYGFSGLPGRGRYGDGSWPPTGLGYSGFWWTSTETSSTNAIYKWLHYNSGHFNDVDFLKQNGSSVRCIKD